MKSISVKQIQEADLKIMELLVLMAGDGVEIESENIVELGVSDITNMALTARHKATGDLYHIPVGHTDYTTLAEILNPLYGENRDITLNRCIRGFNVMKKQFMGMLRVFGLDKNMGVEVKIKRLSEDVNIPEYKTLGAAGMDVEANMSAVIKPGCKALIKTGIAMGIPDGYEIQVRPRSGLALKEFITVLNTPGCIDSDYTGDIGVILVNHGTEDFIVNKGDRVAQLVLAKVSKCKFVEVESLDETERGAGGFGHTGV